MELSRDISVACIQAFADNQRDDSGLTYLDALAGCGIRGFRVANEAQVEVTVNDYNLAAYELIKRNATRFQQNIHVEHRDANALMSEARFNVIDVDPFGSPAPFVDAACRSASKMLCVTATDTAPLSGAHFSAGVRRYSALPMNTEYHAETGIRILIGTIIRELVKYDKSATPVLAHATEHYYRAYLLLDRGAELANACVRSMGFIAHCFACGNRYVLSGLFPTLRSDCVFCGAKVAVAGPLWLGTLHDQKFCLQVLENLETGVFGTKMRAAKIITRCLNELDTVTFFDYHKLLRELKCPPVPIETLVSGLRTAGCRASRTHFSGTSIKTDADADTVKRVLLDLSCESEKARLNRG